MSTELGFEVVTERVNRRKGGRRKSALTLAIEATADHPGTSVKIPVKDRGRPYQCYSSGIRRDFEVHQSTRNGHVYIWAAHKEGKS